MKLPTIHYADRFLFGILPVRHLKVDFKPNEGSRFIPNISALPNRIATDARILYDVLFEPLARRPVGKLVNELFGTQIKHNSAIDIALHSFFITAVVTVCASSIGLALGLSQLVIDCVAIGVIVFIHCRQEDGLLRPLFD